MTLPNKSDLGRKASAPLPREESGKPAKAPNSGSQAKAWAAEVEARVKIRHDRSFQGIIRAGHF